ncbi:MAG TPA: TetR family transcriptional regulator C-terminal domain-containing protein [Candidatus Scatomorpha stercorigallinarum]|nr:TetR family transcriptional regulator C-terminal domain-containing protein [Candidatus Scatomorpha stercorigallinarum]
MSTSGPSASSSRRPSAPPEGETAFLLELYCRGSVAMTVRWVLSGMRTPPAELARHMTDALPAALEKLFRRLRLL